MIVTDTFGTRESYADGSRRAYAGSARAGARVLLLLVTAGAASPLAAQAPADPPAPAATFAWDDHPSLRVGSRLRIDFRARVQLDGRRSEAPFDDNDSGLDVARRRVGIDGEFGDVLAFQVERELAGDERWRDVYVDLRPVTAFRIQAGKFKLPFSLDENTSATSLDFAYRSLAANELAPGRDRGVMVHGRLWRRALGYEAGVFAHDGSNVRPRADDQVRGGRTLAARITSEPFARSKSALASLRAGVAWTGGDVPEGISTIRGTTAFHATFIPADFWVKGSRRRTGIEVEWLPGPVSVKGEYLRASQARNDQSIADTDLEPLVAAGWYISGTWALTGERKSRGLDVPDRPFLRGGAGAVEVAARLEALELRGGAEGDTPTTSPRAPALLGNRDRAFTLGVNWYLNRWIKVQGNAIHETLVDPSRGPLPTQDSFWSHVVRFQLSI